MKILALVSAFSLLAAADEKIYSDAIKKIMDDGQAGTYSLGSLCPDTLVQGKDRIGPEDILLYIQFVHKKILGNTPLNDPAGAAKNLGSVLDAAVALACQAEGNQGRPLSKEEPERWVKALSRTEYKKSTEVADALLDRGYFLQKDGRHEEAIADLKAATKLSPLNELGFLYLADSLWVTKKKTEAKKNYERYVALRHSKYGIHGTMAPQVEERLNEGKPPKK